jgi:hypothetical protein
MFPDASLQTWMPAIHAGMTKICIFMFCGRAYDHELLRGGEVFRRMLNVVGRFARVAKIVQPDVC